MAEYFERESLIKAICEIGDDSKGGMWVNKEKYK